MSREYFRTLVALAVLVVVSCLFAALVSAEDLKPRTDAVEASAELKGAAMALADWLSGMAPSVVFRGLVKASAERWQVQLDLDDGTARLQRAAEPFEAEFEPPFCLAAATAPMCEEHADDAPVWLFGACDSTSECQDRGDELCADAGKCGAKANTAEVTTADNGDRTCTVECACGNAIAFVTCGPAS